MLLWSVGTGVFEFERIAGTLASGIDAYISGEFVDLLLKSGVDQSRGLRCLDK